MKDFKEYNGEDTILETLSDDSGNEYVWVVNESTREVSFATKNPKGVKGFRDFLAKHPFMTGIAVSVGLSALDSYRSNKRLTTRFFATNQVEKRLYTDVVKDLLKTGNYTLLKNGKIVKGGWLWELRRKGV